MRMKDKVALVVGGSHSIGAAITTEFAEQGASTVISSRPGREVPAIVATLNARGLEVDWAPGDMSDPDDMNGVVDHVIARYGRLDVLVVSGAPKGAKAKLFENTAPEDYHRWLDTQFVSRLNCLRAALPAMAAQHYGKVVFVTTDAGRTPTPGESLIGSAAAALIFFTRAAGRELASKGVRINCIAPTLTADTASYDVIKQKDPGDVIAKAFAKLEARTPFRLNMPKDIANVAVFLGSEESDQISGMTVSINGGISFP